MNKDKIMGTVSPLGGIGMSDYAPAPFGSEDATPLRRTTKVPDTPRTPGAAHVVAATCSSHRTFVGNAPNSEVTGKSIGCTTPEAARGFPVFALASCHHYPSQYMPALIPGDISIWDQQQSYSGVTNFRGNSSEGLPVTPHGENPTVNASDSGRSDMADYDADSEGNCSL